MTATNQCPQLLTIGEHEVYCMLREGHKAECVVSMQRVKDAIQGRPPAAESGAPAHEVEKMTPLEKFIKMGESGS